MVTIAQSAANWRNTHTHVNRTHQFTHLHQSSQLVTTRWCEAPAQKLQNLESKVGTTKVSGVRTVVRIRAMFLSILPGQPEKNVSFHTPLWHESLLWKLLQWTRFCSALGSFAAIGYQKKTRSSMKKRNWSAMKSLNEVTTTEPPPSCSRDAIQWRTWSRLPSSCCVQLILSPDSYLWHNLTKSVLSRLYHF